MKEPTSTRESWATMIGSIGEAGTIAPPTAETIVPRVWLVAQPWRTTVPFHRSAPPGVSITTLVIRLYRRVSAAMLDGTAFQLLELVTRRLALAEGGGGEGILDGPLRLVLRATLENFPPAQSLEAEVFCVGWDQLATLLESTRIVSLPESVRLREMLQECASREILRGVTAEREAAEAFCLSRGIAGDGFVSYDRGIFRSPLGEEDNIVVWIRSGEQLGWWFRVG
ncbi:hypothetical protein GGR52DRAFT_586834 [Hypoxylon sp. FL1284]|nr:hypothetical protein GGR52DRAFT_586834 [Hypoxylon sp. FL1284]